MDSMPSNQKVCALMFVKQVPWVMIPESKERPFSYKKS